MSTQTKDEKLLMKQKSAQKAIEYVREKMILGVGSGSTVREFIKLLKKADINLSEIICIPSSFDTEAMLIEQGCQVGALNQYPNIDLTIDGADRVDAELNIIKGGGGALLREKIIAGAAKEVIIIVDESKIVPKLGGSFPVPVEVIPLAKEFVKETLEAMGGRVTLRKASDKLGPTVTDNGNIILDTDFKEIADPEALEMELNKIPGVMENGLFPKGLISRVIVAEKQEIKLLEKA